MTSERRSERDSPAKAGLPTIFFAYARVRVAYGPLRSSPAWSPRCRRYVVEQSTAYGSISSPAMRLSRNEHSDALPGGHHRSLVLLRSVGHSLSAHDFSIADPQEAKYGGEVRREVLRRGKRALRVDTA